MDKIKKLTLDEFTNIASQKPFDQLMVEKDYFVTMLLYLLKDVEGLYFKGGTALQKIFLNYSRLSEDIDFTVTRGIEEVSKEIIEKIKRESLFGEITTDKNVAGFMRLVVHFKGFSNQDDEVFIDLNKRARLLLKPERHKINHFYKNHIPEFYCNTLAKEEMLAEKMAAAIGRNKPRDHFDLYRIIQMKMPINLELVKKKCEQSGDELDITRMFNKAKKLKKKWDKDTHSLIAEEVGFQEVMTTLSKHFNLKEEKEKLRKKN